MIIPGFENLYLCINYIATRISIITTTITLIGLLLLWLIVSTNAASMVKNDITNQMVDALSLIHI